MKGGYVNTQTDWPTPDEERQLLAQLLDNVRTASEALAVRYLPLVTHALTRSFPWVEPELRSDAAGGALLDLVSRPDRYDPARGGLGAFLRMAARRDLLNLIQREKRARRGIPLDSVAEPIDRRNNKRDDELTWDDPRLVAECAALDATEAAALELMRAGVRETATFARRLGLAHLSGDNQTRAVKRVKDRVLKRFARAAEDFR
jgi:hypothetical protein